MKFIYALPLLAGLMACSTPAPKVSTPGLDKPKISMRFEFPQGSVCQVRTSQGVLSMAEMPGAIDFPQSDRLAPASCTLPGGKSVRVTAHNGVPENNVVAGITVYPDGRAFITASLSDGNLIQLQPTGTVK